METYNNQILENKNFTAQIRHLQPNSTSNHMSCQHFVNKKKEITTYQQREAFFAWQRTKQPEKQQNGTKCTHYNLCCQSKHRQVEDKKSLLFEIPKQLEQETELQYIKNIAVSPQGQIQFNGSIASNNQIELVDRYIQSKINQKAKEAAQQRKREKSQKLKRKASLQKVKEEAKIRLKRDVEKRKELEKQGFVPQIRPKWGHGIFNDNNQDQQQNKTNEEAKRATKNKSQTKQIKLQPVEQRLKKYEQKLKALEEKKKAEEACKHKHTNHAKDLVQIQSEIQESARAILAQKKRKLEQEQQKKVIIKGKIRAIQLQSKSNIKKCKKKPVDSTIQFVVDIKPQNLQNSKKGKKNTRQLPTKEVIKSQSQKKQNTNSNIEKMKNYSEKLRKTQKSKQTLKSQSESQPFNGTINQQQDQQTYLRYNDKFYVWNVPVYLEDLQKLEQNYYQPPKSLPQPPKKSFRDQVNQYLQNKLHKDMQENIKQQKLNKFEEQVQKKKAILLEEFQQMHGNKEQRHEMFWDEDQIHRYHPISNFTNF